MKRPLITPLLAVILVAQTTSLPTLAGEVQKNQFAGREQATTKSPLPAGDASAEATKNPSAREINAVSVGLDAARVLVRNEHTKQQRVFEQRDVKEIQKLSESCIKVAKACGLIAKYGYREFMPYMSFENQIFLVENGVVLKVMPYLERTAAKAEQHAKELEAEEKRHRQRHRELAALSSVQTRPRPTLKDFMLTVNHDALQECVVQQGLLGRIAPIWLDRCADFDMYARYLGTTEDAAKRKFKDAIKNCTSASDLTRRLSR